MTILHDVADLGQAIWLDFVRRSHLDSGELDRALANGLRGVTSNPSIFEAAITGGEEYDAPILRLARGGADERSIYETLAIEDIGRAADVLLPLYQASAGEDGYVSLEVSPTLADDTVATVAEARRLYATLSRPNVMIKVPATRAGIPAVSTLIGEGINVNVTLIFSLASYEDVAEAYLEGLEHLVAGGGDPSQVASVASFFISRVDSAVDAELDRLGEPELRGTIAIANARVAFQRFRQIFSGARWEALATRGARVQRPLWASTGTKNPDYPDTLYIDQLIGADTVNTVPPKTLAAFEDHGVAAETLGVDPAQAAARLMRLTALGVDLGAITDRLQAEGVQAFVRAFEGLLTSIAEKKARVLAAAGASGSGAERALAPGGGA